MKGATITAPAATSGTDAQLTGVISREGMREGLLTSLRPSARALVVHGRCRSNRLGGWFFEMTSKSELFQIQPFGSGGTGSCAGGCTGSGASGTGASGGGISGFGIGCTGTSRCGGRGAGESGPGLVGCGLGCSGGGVGDSGLPGTGGVTCICVLTSPTARVVNDTCGQSRRSRGLQPQPWSSAASRGRTDPRSTCRCISVPPLLSLWRLLGPYGVFSAPFFSDFIIA
jgi:hypothetical protein